MAEATGIDSGLSSTELARADSVAGLGWPPKSRSRRPGPTISFRSRRGDGMPKLRRRRKRRGRPRMTQRRRLAELVSAWAEVDASVAAMPPLAVRETQNHQDPIAKRFLKLAALADSEGLLDSPKYSDLAPVQAARARLQVLKNHARPGRPLTVAQLKRDYDACDVVVEALPAHQKWETLYQELRDKPSIPKSWAGFLKLLDRLGLSREEQSPLELAYNMGLVFGPPTPRTVRKRSRELQDALDHRRFSRGLGAPSPRPVARRSPN
jgi:hypothetical protein